ncbi:PxKF domain-containing protein [Microbacterium sp. E-13]|uniref:PxKF domain-containing protein n=1 Tax=Microbacterium sp. E-13 TaxID=3404048 RepID=UPI003CFA56F4
MNNSQSMSFRVLAAAGAVAVILGTLVPAVSAQAAPTPSGIGYVDPWGDNGDGTYTNPVLGTDYADPDAIRVGNDYWAVTSTFVDAPGVSVIHSKDMVNWETVGAGFDDITKLGGSTTFNSFSNYGANRYNWTGMSEYNRGVYAPSIKYNPLNKTFYIAVNTVTGGMFVASTKDPAGHWDMRILKDKFGRDLVTSLWTDPTLFFDEKHDQNGKLVDVDVYYAVAHVAGTSGSDKPDPLQPDVRGNVLFTVDDNVTTLTNADMSKYDLTYTNSSGAQVTLAGQGLLGGDLFGGKRAGPECNKIYKRGEYYHLFYCDFQGRKNNLNEGGISGAGSYMLRSKNLYGTLADGTPGSPGNVGTYEVKYLANDTLPLQGGFIDTPDGDWYFFAQKNDGTQGGARGRQAHLIPVDWPLDGWPVLGGQLGVNGLGTMVWTAPKPVVRDVEKDASGDDTYPGVPTGSPKTYPITSPQGSDDFTAGTLDVRWMWNHQPRSGYWSLTERPGWMRLKAFNTTNRAGNFFLAGDTLHQRHLGSDQTQSAIRLDISRMTDGQRAGLVHFNGGTQSNAIAVQRIAGANRIITESNNNVSAVADLPAGVTVVDLISRTDREQSVAYYYSVDGGTSFQLAGTQKLTAFGGYRGDRIGIFSYNDSYVDNNADGRDDANGALPGSVDVDFFRYEASAPKVEGTGFLTKGSVYFTNAGQSSEVEFYRHGANGQTQRIPNTELTATSSAPDIATVTNGVIRPGTKSGTTTVTVTYQGRFYVADVTVDLTVPTPILNYTFDGDSGTKITDSSGNGFDGTYVAPSSVASVPGVHGSAVNLSGGARTNTSAPYITIPNGVLNGVGGFTVSAWVRWTDSTTSYANLFWLGGAGTGGGSNRYLYMTPRGPGSSYAVGLKPTNTAGEARAQDNNGALPTGKWTHVTVVVNPANNTTTLFRDGMAVAGTNSSATGASLFQTGAAQTGQIGRSQFADPFFGGDIDDFRIYGSALNASRVAELADVTAPSLAAGLDPAAPDGENGWYVGAVSANAVASDAQTGITHLEYRTSPSGTWTAYESPIPAPDGTTDYDFQAVDSAGNTTTAHLSVKRDATAPLTSVVVSPGSGVVLAGSTVSATFSASDETSGVASTEYSTDGGTTWVAATDAGVSFTEVGAHVVKYRSVDAAGNVEQAREVTLTVVQPRTFRGFYAPVDMAGVVNVVKGGSTVPLKFELFSGEQELTSTTAIDSLRTVQHSCDPVAPVDEVETVVAGGTALVYDTQAGRFQYNWKTPKSTGCMDVIVRSTDGSELKAQFRLK